LERMKSTFDRVSPTTGEKSSFKKERASKNCEENPPEVTGQTGGKE